MIPLVSSCMGGGGVHKSTLSVGNNSQAWGQAILPVKWLALVEKLSPVERLAPVERLSPVERFMRYIWDVYFPSLCLLF